ELDSNQDQPDRHAVRDFCRDRDGHACRLHIGRVAPLGRDRGLDDRRHRSRHQRRADQDRLAVALRPHREVQPAPAHRRGPGRRSDLSRPRGILQPALIRTAVRWLALVLLALIVALQYPMWLGKGGWLQVRAYDRQVAQEQEANAKLATRNAALDADVRDLKTGFEAIEER